MYVVPGVTGAVAVTPWTPVAVPVVVAVVPSVAPAAVLTASVNWSAAFTRLATFFFNSIFGGPFVIAQSIRPIAPAGTVTENVPLEPVVVTGVPLMVQAAVMA